MKIELTDRETLLVSAVLNNAINEICLGNLKVILDDDHLVELELIKRKIDVAFRKASK